MFSFAGWGPRLEKLCHRRRSSNEVLAGLRERAIHEGNLSDAVADLVELLAQGPHVLSHTRLGPSAYFEDSRSKRRGETRLMRRSWLRHFGVAQRVLLSLYEDDFGVTRDVFGMLCAELPPVRDIGLLSLHAAMQLQLGELSAGLTVAVVRDIFERLYAHGGPMRAWCAEQSERGCLAELGGVTQTVLRHYDWLATARPAVLQKVPRDVDCAVDLGGGYATPDVSRLLGIDLTSLDRHAPSRASEIGLARMRLDTSGSRRTPGNWWRAHRWQTHEEAQCYRALLERWPSEQFDVFQDDISSDHTSYLVTSFAFISSPTRSASSAAPTSAPLRKGRLAQLATMAAAVACVLRLVAKGKQVTLLSCQGPSSSGLAGRHRAVLLRFADRQLYDHALVTQHLQPESVV